MIEISWECSGCGARVDAGKCPYCGLLQPMAALESEIFTIGYKPLQLPFSNQSWATMECLFEPYKTVNVEGIGIEVHLISPGVSIIKGDDGRVARNINGVYEWVNGCGDIKRFISY